MGTQIRGNAGTSSYFQGKFQGYGRYQWNIKFHGFHTEQEQEDAMMYYLGEHVKVGTKAINGNTMRGFETISELLGRPIESHTAGRSGGWLVIDTELTEAELTTIDVHVALSLKTLPEFLKNEREFRSSEQQEAEAEHLKRVEQHHRDKERLENDPEVKRAIELLDKTGLDFELTIDGIKLV